MAKRKGPAPPPPDPPAGLSEKAAELWRAVVPRRVKEPERLAKLEQALKALDTAELAAAEVRVRGLTVTTESTGMAHQNPLVEVARKARGQFGQLWRDLGLDCGEAEPWDPWDR